MEQIKERPILFNGEMVRAILEGRKTVTRRTIKPQPEYVDSGGRIHKLENLSAGEQEIGIAGLLRDCPYGKPGERLWVRETFWIEHDSDTYEFGPDFDCGINIKEDSWTKVQYCATPANPNKPNQAGTWWPHYDENGPNDKEPKEWVEWRFYSKRPSIHMPRWASRLTLEITEVRVERLARISESDCLAEGINLEAADRTYASAVAAFAGLWDSINGKGNFYNNSWVWVISFRKVEEDSNG